MVISSTLKHNKSVARDCITLLLESLGVLLLVTVLAGNCIHCIVTDDESCSSHDNNLLGIYLPLI